MSIVILLSVKTSAVLLYVRLLIVLAISVSLATLFMFKTLPGTSAVNVLLNCTEPLSITVMFEPIAKASANNEVLLKLTVVVVESFANVNAVYSGVLYTLVLST